MDKQRTLAVGIHPISREILFASTSSSPRFSFLSPLISTMSDETKALDASCLCGAAQHHITLSSSEFPLPFWLCHCDSCRRMTGTLALTETNLPTSYQPSQELLAKLTSFQFSERITDYHCTICGTQILAHCYRDAEYHSKGSSWDAPTGTFERIDGLFEMKGHEQVADTLDGGFADFLTTYQDEPVDRWPHRPGKGEQIPLRWERPDRPKITPKSDDRLHAHCKCGGVEFWIARPSERSRNAPGRSQQWPDLLIPYHSSQQGVEGEPWWLMDNGKKFLGGVCACNSCRLDTGMEWMEWAFIPAMDISLDKEGKVPFNREFGTLKGYNSSEGITRYHCSTCGASVFYFAEDRSYIIDVAAALLDAPEGARAESWLEFWCGRLSYREDAVPRAESLTFAVEKSLKEHGQWKYSNQKKGKDALVEA